MHLDEFLFEDFLCHVGKGHLDGGHSGRYPWGSGKESYQHSTDFLARIDELKKQKAIFVDPDSGQVFTGDTAIAKIFGLSTGQFRRQRSLAKAEERTAEYLRVLKMKESGMSVNAIGKELGKNESSIRSILDAEAKFRMEQAKNAADIIKKRVDEVGLVEVGAGAELELGISKEKLATAIEILKREGYVNVGSRVPQASNPDQMTTLSVIGPPGTQKKDAYDYENIHSLVDYEKETNAKELAPKFVYPASMDSSRLAIRYAEDGGLERDGTIELRRGVQDLDLQGKAYAQVRILVDGTHYIKGMALYSDDMPDGVDVVFNTNKTKDKSKMEVLKEIKKDDPDNPFGSAIKDIDKGGQYYYIDKDTGERKLGLINKRADEGDWSEWKDAVPSQFLSKQNLSLAKRQIDIALNNKYDEYNEIMSLTNPTVKKRLLQAFSEDCDSASVNLQAAALPRQKYQVILPLPSLKDTEVYAPNFENGEKVALVRYPHGGTFEIPIVTVNNKNKEALKRFGPNARDMVAINSNVAGRLSGADFDGDTVMVIPISKTINITSTKPLEGLKGFDPKDKYATVDDGKGNRINRFGQPVKIMGKENTQTEMGIITNLINDMTLKGANEDELAAAVRHSMVVIDANKHKLDYKQSYIDNDIATLKKNYQGRYENGVYKEGASTLISRSKSEYDVPKREGSPKVNLKDKPYYDPNLPEGALIYKTASDDKRFYEKTIKSKRKGHEGEVIGTKIVERVTKSTKMAETQNAFDLVSEMNTPMERLYAGYANALKSLANNARKEMMTAGKIEYSPSANKLYKKEVDELDRALLQSKKNSPREKTANIIAAGIVKAKIKDNPSLAKDKDQMKKTRQRALTSARNSVGAKRTTIDITERQWKAIQAGAISENKLKEILNHTDTDKIKAYATPRKETKTTANAESRILSMKASGKTNSEIAKQLGLSASTVANISSGKED